jgi:hypothetical protein
MAELVIKLVNGELAGKTAQEIAKQIRDAGTAARKAEVGTKAWVDAHAKLEHAKGLQEDLRKQVNATTGASKTLKESFYGILNQIPGFSNLNSVLGQAKGGVGGLTSGFGLLKGAIIATGIGALLIAVTALVGWFSKTEKGANFISAAFNAMGAIVDTLMSKLWNIGDTLRQLFSNPIQFFKNLGNDIKKAASEANDLVYVFDEIEDSQRALAVSDAETQKRVAQLLLQAKNVSASYKERIALIREANDIEKVQFDERMKIAKQYLDAVDREVAAAEKAGTMGGDLADKQKDAKIAVIQLETEYIEFKEKLQNRIDQLNERDVKATETTEKTKTDIKVAAAEEAVAKAEQVEVESEEARKTRLLQEAMARQDLMLQSDTNLLTERFLANQITEDEYALLTTQRLLTSEQERLALIKAAHGEQSAEYQKAYANFLAIQKAAADESVQTTEQLASDQMAALQGGLQVFGNVFGAMAGMYEQGTAQWKQMAIAQATISTMQGAINAYTSTSAIPIIGPGLAPVAAALALAAGFANIRKIESTKVKSPVKKELGGLLVGPRHSQGGIPIEAEGGEFIFSRKAVRSIGVNTLSRVNNFYTKRFAAGGPVDPFQDRAPVFRSASSGNMAPFMGSEKPSWVDELIAAQDRRLDRLKVYNVVTETEDGIKTINRIKNDADV